MRVAVMLVAGCGATPGAAISHRVDSPPVPDITLVVKSGARIRFVETTPTGLIVRRVVELPTAISQLEVANSGAIALLDDGTTIERITTSGFEPVPAFPAGTFDVKQPDGANRLDTPLVAIEVDTSGDAWRGECHWGGLEDGGWCSPWVFAKLDANPPVRRVEPSMEHSMVQLPMLAPPVSPVVAIVPRSLATSSEPVAILTCTEKGRTVEYPLADDRNGYLGVTDLIWLQREPPVYRVVLHYTGYNGIDAQAIFEGCAPSKRFAHPELASGPHDVTAILSDQELTVLWHGRELGRLGGVSSVVFGR